MAYGLAQGALYGLRGLGADGGGIRNRSAEQYNSASGNPGLPIFNTPGQQMQQRTYTSPTSTMPVNTGAIPMPKFSNGTMGSPGMYGRLPTNGAPPTDASLYAAQQAGQVDNSVYGNRMRAAPAFGQGGGTFGTIGSLMGQQQQAAPMPVAAPQPQGNAAAYASLMPQFRWR